MHLEILTPEKKIYEGEVDMVQVPGSEEKGSFAILNNHAPIISSLMPGRLKIKNGSEEKEFIIKGGFVEALNNKVSVLVEGIVEKV